MTGRGLDYRQMGLRLCEGFTEHDSVGLGELSADELVAQYEARLVLAEYVEQMGRQLIARSSAVEGLREVIAELLANAEDVGAGD